MLCRSSKRRNNRANVWGTPSASAAMLIPLEPDTTSHPMAHIIRMPIINLFSIRLVRSRATFLKSTGESLCATVHELLVDLHIAEICETIGGSDGLLPVRTIILDFLDGQIMHGV